MKWHMQYLKREDILDIHGYLVERFGGRLGLNSLDRLIGLVVSQTQTCFGEELYPDLPAKIAALSYTLIKNRPFRSGNTATALLVALRLAQINDQTIDDIEGLTHELAAAARSERSQEQLLQWFNDHLIPGALTIQPR